MIIPKENKIIAEIVTDAFGGQPQIIRHEDDENNSIIDILSVADKPSNGVKSYSTIGLNAYEIMEISDGTPLSVEFVGACCSEYDYFSNIIATCAFNVINSEFSCYPGEVYKDVVQMYYGKLSMKHVMFFPPFLWDDKLETIDFKYNKTAWLLVVPISDKELKFLNENDSDSLGNIFEEQQIDIFDLNRKSVI